MTVRTALLPLCLLHAACAFSPGNPYGALGGELSGHYDATATRSALGYEVHVATFTLELGPLALQGARATTPDTQETLAEVPLPPLALVPGERAALLCDEAPCALPRSTLSQVTLPIGAVSLSGTVSDAQEPPRFAGTRPFQLEVGLGAGELTLVSPLERAFDGSAPPEATVGFAFTPTVALFAGVDFAQLPADEADLPEAAARQVLAQLAATPLEQAEAGQR